MQNLKQSKPFYEIIKLSFKSWKMNIKLFVYFAGRLLKITIQAMLKFNQFKT